MADTLSRLAGPANAASGTSTMFTGTTAHTYTIKRIRLVNTTAAAITVKVGVGGVADANLIMPAISIDAGGFMDSNDFLVLSGTETLQINTSATGITYTISGLDQS